MGYRINMNLAIEAYEKKNKKKWSRNKITKEYKIVRNTILNYERGKGLNCIDFIVFLMDQTGLEFKDLLKKK